MMRVKDVFLIWFTVSFDKATIPRTINGIIIRKIIPIIMPEIIRSDICGAFWVKSKPRKRDNSVPCARNSPRRSPSPKPAIK
jgi:hypothetical protein